jgi:hypothetical protein
LNYQTVRLLDNIVGYSVHCSIHLLRRCPLPMHSIKSNAQHTGYASRHAVRVSMSTFLPRFSHAKSFSSKTSCSRSATAGTSSGALFALRPRLPARHRLLQSPFRRNPLGKRAASWICCCGARALQSVHLHLPHVLTFAFALPSPSLTRARRPAFGRRCFTVEGEETSGLCDAI